MSHVSDSDSGAESSEAALPADNHVHTQWSWDAADGSMVRACARAVALGVPAVAFTDHADYTTSKLAVSELNAFPAGLVSSDGLLTPPPLDLTGYLECLQRCRDQFPGLRILSGVELGEPHWHATAAAALLQAGQFDRVLGSLHCLRVDGHAMEPPNLFHHLPPGRVIRDYLAEVTRMIQTSGAFSVLAHIDYPLRAWPSHAGPIDLPAFEPEFRGALRALAHTGRALEINTNHAIRPELVRWWREEGGDAVSFGSDAHTAEGLAREFLRAAAVAEACGYRPAANPYELWRRS